MPHSRYEMTRQEYINMFVLSFFYGMKIIDSQIQLRQLVGMQEHYFGDMVKGVVDVKRGLLAVDAELHADLEKYLLESGSAQPDLWGINLYPELEGDEFLEFDSIINIRPGQNNPSWDVLDPVVREKIRTLVSSLVV